MGGKKYCKSFLISFRKHRISLYPGLAQDSRIHYTTIAINILHFNILHFKQLTLATCSPFLTCPKSGQWRAALAGRARAYLSSSPAGNRSLHEPLSSFEMARTKQTKAQQVPDIYRQRSSYQLGQWFCANLL